MNLNRDEIIGLKYCLNAETFFDPLDFPNFD